MDTKQALAGLSSLAQESRLAVFRLLVQVGPEGMAASKIAERLDISPSSLSFHLKELSHAGLVTQERLGRYLIYRASFEQMNELLAYLTANCCQGEQCLDMKAAPCKC